MAKTIDPPFGAMWHDEACICIHIHVVTSASACSTAIQRPGRVGAFLRLVWLAGLSDGPRPEANNSTRLGDARGRSPPRMEKCKAIKTHAGKLTALAGEVSQDDSVTADLWLAEAALAR